jgi:hypothetical protein
MVEILFQETGGYRYLRGSKHRSAGVAAEIGFTIRRVRLRQPLKLEEGFAVVRTFLRGIGRPLSAFCACELRCPAPLSDHDLQAFNQQYNAMLAGWGLIRNGESPLARSDVCPEFAPPGAPAFHAFCVTVPQPRAGAGSFVTSGSSGAHAQAARTGDTTQIAPAALRTNTEHVLAELEARMCALGFGWRHATATQLYTVHDFHPFMAEIIERRGAAPGGLTWHLARPPVLGSDCQMDVRGVAVETVL